LIVGYNGRELIGDCLDSIQRVRDDRVDARIVVVDNASKDGTAELVAQRHPDVMLVKSDTNLGFAGGNDLGWKAAREKWPDLKYLVLLNQDTVVRAGWLTALVDFMESDPEAGMAQAKILLHPETDLINTDGNESHFLGFGFPGRYREKDTATEHPPFEVGFASGACAIVRVSAVTGFETLFPGHFFLYLEDTHLSWRLRLAGHPSWSVPASKVEHKYTFTAIDKQYYHLEKNRLWMLLVFYKKRTLLLILPAILFMEAGQWVFALAKGLLGQRIKVYGYILRSLGTIARERRAMQKSRRVTDFAFTRAFVGEINTEQLKSPLVKWVASPILRAYWAVAKELILW
jgi:GT2 family glycosyltransferase